jgi:hypothetical protein
MAPSSRDRISVDLRGLKATLFQRAQALGVSPSGLVRTTLAEALGRSDPTDIDRSMQSLKSGTGDRVPPPASTRSKSAAGLRSIQWLRTAMRNMRLM